MAGHSVQGVVRVGRKPKTASETEIVRLITATNESTPIGNFTQLVKDMTAAGIVIGKDSVAIKAKQTSVIGSDGSTIALFDTDGKKLNANLIDADTITMNHLYAKSAEGGTIVGHFGNYDKDDAVVGSDRCPLWLGAAQAKDAPFRVTKDGSLYASKGIFKGELRGVKGSFQTLSAVSSNEKVKAGTLSFNSDGYIDIEGDLRFQGMVNGRSGVLYGGTIYSRGAFGHRLSTFALVVGSMMYVYPFGTDYPDKREIVYLSSQQYDGKTVYNIPLYGMYSKYSGCPIDVVAFKNNTDRSEYYYEFIPGGTGKRWMAVNIRDTNNGVYFCDVGGWHQLNGGETINLVYIQPDMLTPSQENKTYYGRGIFWSGEHDLDWSNR